MTSYKNVRKYAGNVSRFDGATFPAFVIIGSENQQEDSNYEYS